ncbi:hypothetical protein ACFLW6_01320 [Chloroflexota bacterium]
MSKKRKGREQARLPVATVAYYGPDDRTPTKVAVGIVTEWGKEPAELKRWWGRNVTRDAVIQQQISDFIAAHRARSVVVTEGIIGCPHEEGLDFPSGQECPYCPFWHGKQPDVKTSVFCMETPRPTAAKPGKSRGVIAMATYAREQWGKLLEVADDRAELESSWEEWQAGKQDAITNIRRQGLEPIEILVDVEALQEFCRKRSLRNDSEARAEYAAYQAQRRRQSDNLL